MNFYMPTKLYTGKDVILHNKSQFESLGKSALIITGRNSAKSSGALKDVTDALDSLNIQYVIYDEVLQNPTVASCIEAGLLAHENGCEFVVGIGGGSPLDAAKAAAIFAVNPGLTEEGMYKANYSKVLPIVAVGTTSGTGSEVTKVSVLTNSKGLKKSIHNDLLYPVYSFGDPKYTLNLPYDFTVSTAIDAFAHLLESYYSKKSDDITRAYSLKGTKMIAPILKKLINKDYILPYEDRETLYNASILGGMAIAQTGTCFPHTMGYYLSENFHIPHGFACAVYMPDIIEYENVHNKEYSDILFENLKMNHMDFVSLIEKLIPEYDIKLSEQQLQEVLPRYINNNSVINTMGNLMVDDIEKIIRKHFLR